MERVRRAQPDVRQRERERGRQWKRRAMEILGDACLRCGFSDDPGALQIDHIADDGKDHRKEVHSSKILQWIVFHPEEAVQRVQILCANCNMIKLARWHERRRKAA